MNYVAIIIDFDSWLASSLIKNWRSIPREFGSNPLYEGQDYYLATLKAGQGLTASCRGYRFAHN